MSNGSAMRCESPGTLSIHTFRGFPRIVRMGTPAASAGRLFAPQWPTFLRLTSNLVGRHSHDPQGLQAAAGGGLPDCGGVATHYAGSQTSSRRATGQARGPHAAYPVRLRLRLV